MGLWSERAGAVGQRVVQGYGAKRARLIDLDWRSFGSDGDLYESTIQVLEGFYPKLSPGGFCIVDDYGAMPMLPGGYRADYRAGPRSE